jgi:carbamoyl-phosphate synthase small subunit
MTSDRAVLILEDGTTFEGHPFGARGETIGETVFYTGVVGYQEVLTSPSYRGTLAALTYPIVGSYGVNDEDNESAAVQASGVIIRDYSDYYSNFRATGALEPLLEEQGVVGIRGVDTRALAVHVRENGEQRGLIASGDGLDTDALLDKLRSAPSPFASDLLADLPAAQAPAAQDNGKPTIALLDLGATRSLLRHIAAAGAKLEIVPAQAAAEDILAKNARGVIIAGGPGDPRVPNYAVKTVESLLGETPVLGIGLGCQVLALALGGQVKRLTAGHHGVNQPVKQHATGRCAITVQHHSFVVESDSLPDGVEATHVNVNDQTIEGIRSRDAAARGLQFHPIPDETGNPNELLVEFIQGAPRS